MNNLKYIGIDVAKNHLDIYISPQNKSKRFKNNEFGILSLMEFIGKPQEIERIILEPTGGYEELALETLASYGYNICQVNAAQVRAFAKANGILAKTDKIDAKVLADYGTKLPCRIYVALSPELKILRKYINRRRQLLRMIVEEKNRLIKEKDDEIILFIKEILTSLTNQKKLLEAKIIAKINNNINLTEIKKVLQSIKGIGDITAAILIADLPELGKLNNNQIAKLVGVAPLNKESGMMRGKSKIAGGRRHIRDTLYLAALPAIRFEPALHEFYSRLKLNGKPGKLAVIAVVHKMITILNARLRDFYSPAQMSRAFL